MTVPGLSEDIMAGLEGNSKKLRAKFDGEGDKNGIVRGEDAEVEKKS